jgi:hypothetical protein
MPWLIEIAMKLSVITLNFKISFGCKVLKYCDEIMLEFRALVITHQQKDGINRIKEKQLWSTRNFQSPVQTIQHQRWAVATCISVMDRWE